MLVNQVKGDHAANEANMAAYLGITNKELYMATNLARTNKELEAFSWYEITQVQGAKTLRPTP